MAAPSQALEKALLSLQQNLQLYLQLGKEAGVYPTAYPMVEKALHCLTSLLDIQSIDDEELYALWKNYQKEVTKWQSTTRKC